MARGKTPTQRTVRCYHCEHLHAISSRATRVSCPKCAKSLLVQNVTIRTTEGWSHFKTCGKVIILSKGKLVAKTIEAHGGVEVRGGLDTQSYVGGPVVLKKSATWRGDCAAPSVIVDAGARVISGMFNISSSP